nr:DUF6543 domain-containing protein [uncultured Pseudomonas sp.]
MPEPLTPVLTSEERFPSDFRGVHYDFLKSRIPHWFMQASAARQAELARQELHLPSWYLKANPSARSSLSASHSRLRTTLNTVETKLGRIEDVQAFARPLLTQALKQQFNLDLDVTRVYFARKYAFKGRDDVGGFLVFEPSTPPSVNVRYRGISLLEAALANFEPDEEKPSPCSDCQIITTWSVYDGDVLATFDAVNSQALPIAPHEFAKLCRTLNLGALYQAHITSIVGPAGSTGRTALGRHLQEHLREQWLMSIRVARLQSAAQPGTGIGETVRPMLLQLARDGMGITLDARPVTCAALKVLDCVLVGPLVIGPARAASDRVERVVVYIPDDPLQPLKEYASSAEFMVDLRTRLQSIAYRRFFSRFVPLQEQGALFKRFNALYQPTGIDAQADYPLRARLARLPLETVAITGAVWPHLSQAYLNKIFADARHIAVPTGDEDRKARLNRLDNYLSAVTNVFNLAAFIVPGLGPIMLVLGAAQMMSDVFEGIEAYEQGQIREMWAHLASVALNSAFIATGATVIPKVQWVSQVERMKMVSVAPDRQQLWSPDLEAYERTDRTPLERADENGLARHDGHTSLTIGEACYSIVEDLSTGHHRILHPTRPDAYQPHVRHNGQGAWLHEADRPLTWTGAPLMRRLGPLMQGFSDSELAQIRRVSGIEEDQLRRVHAESEPTPAVLLETARQFRAYGDAMKVSEQIGRGQLTGELSSFAAVLMTELPGWPQGKVIEVYEGSSGAVVRYGSEVTPGADVLRIRRSELMQGQLSVRVVENLGVDQLKALLGQNLSDNAVLVRQLNERLQAHGNKHLARLFRSVHADRQPPDNPAIRLIQRDFKHLPTQVVQELLVDASAAERAFIASKERIPLRLAQAARALQARMRLLFAYEGLYLEGLANADTETLVLNTLPKLPGWQDDIRLEVRDDSFDGPLRASFGSETASHCKVLARTGDGRYQAFDKEGNQLHGVNGLYGSLQHALTDSHRTAIGLPHVGQGEQLKELIAENALPRAQLREVLGMQPEKKPFFRPLTTWVDGRRGYPLSGRGGNIWDEGVRERILSLYPDFTEEEVVALRIENGWFDVQWLRTLEQEHKDFESAMAGWLATSLESVEPYSLERDRVRTVTRIVYEGLRNALKRTGPRHYDDNFQYVGQEIKWVGLTLKEYLPTLPDLRANFDHVTRLVLRSSGVTDDGARRLLVNFRGLRSLELQGGELTALPRAIRNMPHLHSLILRDNLIALNPMEVQMLSKATRLEELSLGDNPLTQAPDVSAMTRLRGLWLSNTGLETWPAGVFRLPRPREFRLDLTANPINRIPVFAPGSDNALIVARTYLSREHLEPQLLAQFKQYIEAAGNDPERRFPVRGDYERTLWDTGVPEDELPSRQALWDFLEQSFGSEGFFDELSALRYSGDATVDAGRLLPELTAKVWRMLEAMGEDAELREQLFLMARNPSACVDAGAQLFNAMGVEVLLRAAYFSEDASVVRRSVFNLARGKWRLDELGRIAHDRVEQLKDQGVAYPQYNDEGARIIQYNAEGEQIAPIDEVEIYLSYTAPLAARLDLPWQAKSMAYKEEYVTPEMVEAAFTRVKALEEGELLQGNLIGQPMWVDYLHRAHAQAFSAIKNQFEALIDLETALATWLGTDALSTQERETLRATIQRTSAVLGRTGPASQPGYVMTQEEYDRVFARIDADYQRLLSRLTEQAISALSPES